MKTSLIGIILSMFFFQCSSQANNSETDTQLVEKTEKIRNWLVKEEYNNVPTDFNNQMTEALKPEQIQQVWEGLIKQMGSYDSYGETSSGEIQGYRVVYSILKFEKAPIKLKVVYDGEDKVAGLFFVPVNAK